MLPALQSYFIRNTLWLSVTLLHYTKTSQLHLHNYCVFNFSFYVILCIMSCRQCLRQRHCSYATIVLCIHHCKWVAHVNLSINRDDDDDLHKLTFCVTFWSCHNLTLNSGLICTGKEQLTCAYLIVWTFTSAAVMCLINPLLQIRLSVEALPLLHARIMTH